MKVAKRTPYRSQERRFNPKVCPTCPKYNGEECIVEKSCVEFEDKIKVVTEVIPLDKTNPFKRKPFCELKATTIKYVDRRTRNKSLLV